MVFVTGATGFLGRQLVPALLARGHSVRALVRTGALSKMAPRQGLSLIEGDPLARTSYQAALDGVDTLVHLVGTPKPAPWKGAQFRAVDLVSLRESVSAACLSGIRHMVYVSVAHPAPIMKDYIAVRRECESIIRQSSIPATILRPWYVLGPGRRWPLVLSPLYALAGRMGWEGSQRLGLLRHDEMIQALIWGVEHPGNHVLSVGDIRGVAGTEQQ